MKIKIIKEGKYCLHPALGPIVDLKKGVIDAEEKDGYTEHVIDMLVDNGWAKRPSNGVGRPKGSGKDSELEQVENAESR